MQAIVTSYVPPTNTKPQRIKVTTVIGSKLYKWDHGIDAHANHKAVAVQHAKNLGWVKSGDQIVFGGNPKDSGYTAVIVCDYSTIIVE